MGSLLFGAIDGSKFVGKLKKLPLIRKKSLKGKYDHFRVGLTGLAVDIGNDTYDVDLKTKSLDVVLDTGATVTYLPPDVVEPLWRRIGAVYNPAWNAATLPCSKMKSGEMRFKFGRGDGPLIAVPMEEMVLYPNLSPRRLTNFIFGLFGRKKAAPQTCQFGIRNSTRQSILGDTFLRSAYVVYDLVNNEVAIAQAVTSPATEPEVIPFPRYGAAIPDLVRGTYDE